MLHVSEIDGDKTTANTAAAAQCCNYRYSSGIPEPLTVGKFN